MKESYFAAGVSRTPRFHLLNHVSKRSSVEALFEPTYSPVAPWAYAGFRLGPEFGPVSLEVKGRLSPCAWIEPAYTRHLPQLIRQLMPVGHIG